MADCRGKIQLTVAMVRKEFGAKEIAKAWDTVGYRGPDEWVITMRGMDYYYDDEVQDELNYKMSHEFYLLVREGKI